MRATRTVLGQGRWLKILLVLALLIPPAVARDFNPSNTAGVVRQVLMHPMINDLAPLVVLAKCALLIVVVVCLLRPKLLGPLGWGYYAVVVTVIAFGQNIAVTNDYGFAWLIGNTVNQLVVAGAAATDVWRRRTKASPDQLRRARLWVLAPAALAWLFPYVIVGDDARAGLPLAALVNESGLTYCMVTPVVLSLMILYADGVHPPTLSIAAWTGLLFGITNAVTWFVLAPASWWMGVLHLPLLILSAYALLLSRSRPVLG